MLYKRYIKLIWMFPSIIYEAGVSPGCTRAITTIDLLRDHPFALAFCHRSICSWEIPICPQSIFPEINCMSYDSQKFPLDIFRQIDVIKIFIGGKGTVINKSIRWQMRILRWHITGGKMRGTWVIPDLLPSPIESKSMLRFCSVCPSTLTTFLDDYYLI